MEVLNGIKIRDDALLEAFATEYAAATGKTAEQGKAWALGIAARVNNSVDLNKMPGEDDASAPYQVTNEDQVNWMYYVFKQFKLAYGNSNAWVEKAFGSIGKQSQDEIDAAMEFTKKIFKEADVDGDGRLNREEQKAFFQARNEDMKKYGEMQDYANVGLFHDSQYNKLNSLSEGEGWTIQDYYKMVTITMSLTAQVFAPNEEVKALKKIEFDEAFKDYEKSNFEMLWKRKQDEDNKRAKAFLQEFEEQDQDKDGFLTQDECFNFSKKLMEQEAIKLDDDITKKWVEDFMAKVGINDKISFVDFAVFE